jgi:hypothetical protein
MDLAGTSDSKNATFHIVRTTLPPAGQTEYLRFDLPYYLLLLLLGPAVGYAVYRVRAYRIQSLEERRDEIGLEQNKADLKELDEEGL